MSTTVSVGSMTMTSNSESAEDMVADLTPKEDEKPQPKVLVDKGVPVEDEEPKEGLSKAAAELGKKGGEAAARARKAAEKADKGKEKAAAAEGDGEEEPDEAEKARKEAAEEIEAEPDPEKRRQLASDRVKESTRQAAEAKRALRAAEERHQRELAAIRAEVARSQPRQEEQPDEPAQARALTEKPRSENYENYDEYLDDRDRWNRQEWQHEQEREAYAHDYATRATQGIETFRGRVAEAIKADPDLANDVIPFEDVLRNSSLRVPPGHETAFNMVNDAILESDVPGPLMRYFRQNPDDVRALLRLGPDRAAIARKMGSIEERIRKSLEGATAGNPPPKRAVSQAPTPVRPVTGTPRAAADELDDSRPLSDFVKRFGERELRSAR